MKKISLLISSFALICSMGCSTINNTKDPSMLSRANDEVCQVVDEVSKLALLEMNSDKSLEHDKYEYEYEIELCKSALGREKGYGIVSLTQYDKEASIPIREIEFFLALINISGEWKVISFNMLYDESLLGQETETKTDNKLHSIIYNKGE